MIDNLGIALTDNDVVKAHEGMTPNDQLNLYRNLYYKDGCATEQGIIANAINGILPEYTRQKAEIERLETVLSAMRGAASSYKMHYDNTKTEIARWKEEANHYQTLWCKAAEDAHIAKSEAIKEFAERLKDAFPEGNRDAKCPAIYYDDYCDIIDELVEEMTQT